MSTDQLVARLYNKKLMPLSQFKDQFLDYMLSAVQTMATDTFNKDGVFTAVTPVTPTGNNMISIAGAFRAVTGSGRTISVGALDARLQSVKVAPDAAVAYNVGLEQALVDKGIETNPRTGEFEYGSFQELLGRVAVPDSVTDNGDGTVTLVVNSLFESGKDNSGRNVRVWLKSRSDGGIGPLSAVEAVAIETRPVTYSAPNNRITTVAKFGQGVVSTVAANYRVMSIGPTVKRTAHEDLRNTSGCVFLAAVTSVAAAAPIVAIDTTDQNIISLSLAETDDAITDLRSGFNETRRSGVISGFSDGGNVGLTMTVNGGLYWMSGLRVGKLVDTVVLGDNQSNFVYIDTDGDLKATGVMATAMQFPRLPLYVVVTSAGARVSITDMRRFWTRLDARDHVTVGTLNCDFTTLAAACKWVEVNQTDGEQTAIEILIKTNITMAAPIDLGLPTVIRGLNKQVSVTTPSGTHAFIAGSVARVKFINVYWNLPTAVNTKFLDMSISDDVAEDWEIIGCKFQGGRDKHIIDATSLEVGHSLKGWKIRDNYFQSPLHSSTTWFSIALQQAVDCEIANNRFEGSTADTFTSGVVLTKGSTDNCVERNRFSIGGKAYEVLDVNITASMNASSMRNRFTHNKISGARATSVRLGCADGPNYVEDNDFIGGMVGSGGVNGAIQVNTVSGFGGGILVARRNNHIDWEAGAAVSVDSGNDHRIEDNILRTNVAAVVLGVTFAAASARCFITGNTIDLDRGAAAGAGKPAAVAIDGSALTDSTISRNVLVNIGDDTTVTAGVVKLDDRNIAEGNIFRSCRGVYFLVNGANNIFLANMMDPAGGGGAGAGTSGFNLTAGAEDTLIVGNQVNYLGGGTVATVNAALTRVKMVGNITSVGQAFDTATPRAISNVGVYRGTSNPASQSWPVGVTVVATVPFPPRFVGAHMPKRWQLAAKVGNVESGIRFGWSDGTTTDRFNTTAGIIDETMDSFYLDAKHDLAISYISWVIRNVAGIAEVADPLTSKYEGWVMG